MTDLLSYDDVHELLKMAVTDMDAMVDQIWQDKQDRDLSWGEVSGPFTNEMGRCGQNAAMAGNQYATWFDPELWKEGFDFGWDFRGDIERMSSGLGIPVSRKNLDTLHRALTGGEPIPTHELEQTLGFEKAKAVGRTVMLNIYNKAALRRWAKDGLLRVRRMEMRDRKTCPLCRALHGQEYIIQDLLQRQYPLTEDSHPSCLLPGSLVSVPLSEIVRGFVSTYSGPVVELVLSDGRRISSTVNHMFLTPEGFVRAGHLCEGDHVVGSPLPQKNLLIGPDNDNKPAPIEEVIRSFSESSSVSSRSVPPSPEYLHGDGVFVDGEIDVIGPHSQLRGDLKPGILQELAELPLHRAIRALRDLPSLSLSSKLLFGLACATDGGMGSLREFKSLFLTKLRHANLVGVGGRPPGLSHLIQPSEHGDFVNGEFLGDLNGGETGPVETDNLVLVGRATNLDTHLGKSSVNRGDSDAKRLGQVFDAFPGQAAPLQVVHINRDFFHGPVYDLQTVSSCYWANGIVSSNCRGTFIPVLDMAVYDPERREVPTGMDFEIDGSTAENVPLEVKPWLYSFLRGSPLPMNIRFDESIPEAYTWEGMDVTINPAAIRQEDPREIILHSIADQVWDSVQEKFEGQYIPLIMDGRAAPAKSWSDNKELFINNYTAYRMGQDQFPHSIAWLAKHVG